MRFAFMFKHILFFASLLLLVSTTCAANTPPSGKIILSGVVLDAESNELLTGALVKVPGTSIYTFTDEQGKFSLEFTPSGASHELEISLVSFASVKIKVETPSSSVQVELHEK